MNSFAAAGNFGVGLTNSTIWASRRWLNEFKTVSDGTTGAWGVAAGKPAIDVTKVTVSNSNVRQVTDITIDFTLPAAGGTADSNYVAVQLPYQWMGVAKWADGSLAPSMSLSVAAVSGTGATAKTTYSTVKCAVGMVSGCHATCTLDAKATTNKVFKERSADGTTPGMYRLVVGGVPGPENGAAAATMNLGSLVLSVGKTTTGGLGYSSA